MRNLWMWGLAVGMGLMVGCMPIQAPAAVSENRTVAPVEDAAPTPDELETRATSVSPDGQWRAESVVAFPTSRDEYYQRLTVTRSDGHVTWTPVETWSHMGLGYIVAVPLQWAVHGDALYYTNMPVPDGCAVFVNGSDLQRLDLITGEVREVMPMNGLALALSPSEDQVAVVLYGPPTLVIHDLKTRTSPPPLLALAETGDFTQAGSLVWSPDGTRIALALAHDPCMGGWARATSVLVVDATTLEATTLLAEDDRLLKPVEWRTADALTLEGEVGTRFILNLETGELTPGL